MKSVTYIEAATLASWLKDATLKAGVDYLIVDVRTYDYTSTHIPTSIHVPATSFLNPEYEIPKPPAIPENLKVAKKLIFHCTLSQERGPSCAREWIRLNKNNPLNQEIYVLDGGYKRWAMTFARNPDMFETEPTV